MDYWDDDFEGEQELVAADEQDFKSSKDAVLFAIDISESMLSVPEGGTDCAAKLALKAVYEAITDRILSSPVDASGVVLFGTKEDPTAEVKTCRILLDVELPDSAGLKNLKRLIEDETYFKEICIPRSEPGAPLSDLFYIALQQFDRSVPIKSAARRIFLITDEDDPASGDDHKRTAAKTRAKDLVEKNVRIEPLFISSPQKPFVTSKFYDDLDFSQDSVDNDDLLGPELSLERYIVSSLSELSVKQSINSRHILRHSLFRNEIELSPDLRIGVKAFLTCTRKKPTRSRYVHTLGEQPLLASVETKYMSSVSGDEVKPENARRGYTFGGGPVMFTPRQMEAIRKFDDPVIRVLGFKPIDTIAPWMNMRSSMFLYPSDAVLAGSIRAFATLLKVMLSKQRAAICWIIQRLNSTPILGALIPSAEQTDNVDGRTVQTSPPGFHLIRLPFSDDLRVKPGYSSTNASTSTVETMKELLNSATMVKYDPNRYSNPSLQWFNSILQAVALHEELPETPVDRTVPKFKSLNKLLREVIPKVKASIDEDVSQTVRDRVDPSPPIPSKRQKPSAENREDFISAYKSGTLETYTLKDLKRFVDMTDDLVTPKSSVKRVIYEHVREYLERTVG